MADNIGRVSYRTFLPGSLLILLLLLIPFVLSNRPVEMILGVFVLFVIFFFSGYLFLTLLTSLPIGLRTLLTIPFGIVSITTAYDVFARTSKATYFPYLVVALSVAG